MGQILQKQGHEGYVHGGEVWKLQKVWYQTIQFVVLKYLTEHIEKYTRWRNEPKYNHDQKLILYGLVKMTTNVLI